MNYHAGQLLLIPCFCGCDTNCLHYFQPVVIAVDSKQP